MYLRLDNSVKVNVPLQPYRSWQTDREDRVFNALGFFTLLLLDLGLPLVPPLDTATGTWPPELMDGGQSGLFQ